MIRDTLYIPQHDWLGAHSLISLVCGVFDVGGALCKVGALKVGPTFSVWDQTKCHI